ncbi:MAG: cupin domain-containing protein [Solirubrobacterales bacterium]
MRRFNIANPELEHTDDPEGFKSAGVKLGPLIGAEHLGASLFELEPGQAICPYHYEYGDEEWVLVLRGTPTVRHPEGSEVLDTWDVVCFPRGPEGAHQVRNESEDLVRVLMFSSVVYPTVTVYPDSDKIGVYPGNDEDKLMVRRSSGVDYFDGEASG